MYIFIHFSHFRLKEIHNFWDLLMPLMMIVCRHETVLEGSPEPPPPDRATAWLLEHNLFTLATPAGPRRHVSTPLLVLGTLTS